MEHPADFAGVPSVHERSVHSSARRPVWSAKQTLRSRSIRPNVDRGDLQTRFVARAGELLASGLLAGGAIVLVLRMLSGVRDGEWASSDESAARPLSVDTTPALNSPSAIR